MKAIRSQDSTERATQVEELENKFDATVKKKTTAINKMVRKPSSLSSLSLVTSNQSTL